MGETRFEPDRSIDKGRKPSAARITRRQFATLVGAMAAGGAAVAVTIGVGSRRASRSSPGTDKVSLPPNPSHSPAFGGWATPDNSVVLMTQRGREFLAYRLNGTGSLVWQSCNGKNSRDAIAQMYVQRTGRPAAEAARFLQSLVDLGIIVCGGYVIASGQFPKPAPGECYHVRTDAEPAWSGHEA